MSSMWLREWVGSLSHKKEAGMSLLELRLKLAALQASESAVRASMVVLEALAACPHQQHRSK